MRSCTAKAIKSAARRIERTGQPPPRRSTWEKVLREHWRETPHDRKRKFWMLVEKLTV